VTPVLVVAVFGLAACSNSQQSSEVKGTTPSVWTGSAGAGAAPASGGQAPASDSVSVQLKDPSGAQVGTATIAKTDNYLTITVDAHGLKPGFHGMHFHQVGKCEPNSTAPAGGAPGNFLSAGGHLQVGGQSMTGLASGQLTSVEVRQDGTAHLVTTTDAVSLDDVKGKSLIIHEGPDNFDNIPNRYTQAGGTPGPDAETMATGDAGHRVACGVVG
jgi:Cu-Zn family superoxide dismutase